MKSLPWIVALVASQATAFAAPLDLSSCVGLALRNNPSIADARDGRDAASLGETLAHAEYDLKIVPTVDGGLQGANETNQRYELAFHRRLRATGTELSVMGGTRVSSSVPQVAIPYFSEGRVEVAQPLLRGWRRIETQARIEGAERERASAENALAGQREGVVLAVVRAYYDVVLSRELEGVARASLERVEDLRKIAEGKLSIGVVSKMDVFRAELHLGRVRNQLIAQEGEREAALDSLKLLLGLDLDVDLEVDRRLQGPLPPATAEVVARALEARAEVREARERVADAERQLLLARYRVLPDVKLAGSYARQGFGDRFDDSLALDRDEWTVGVRSSVSLDRTPETIEVLRSELALRRAERQYRLVRRGVVRDVRAATRQLDQARATRVLAQESLELAEKQAELARYRYDQGVTNNLDLVQAEQEQTGARAGLVRARVAEVLASAYLRHAGGILVEAFPEVDEGRPS